MSKNLINFIDLVKKVREAYNHEDEEDTKKAVGIITEAFNHLEDVDRFKIIIAGAGNEEAETIERAKIANQEVLETENQKHMISLKVWIFKVIVITVIGLFGIVFVFSAGIGMVYTSNQGTNVLLEMTAFFANLLKNFYL